MLLAKSRRLVEWYDALNLRIVIFRLGWTVPITEERFRLSADEHMRIAAAMRRDRDEAQRLLEAHILRIRDQTVERMLRTGAAAAAAPAPAWYSLASGSTGNDGLPSATA